MTEPASSPGRGASPASAGRSRKALVGRFLRGGVLLGLASYTAWNSGRDPGLLTARAAASQNQPESSLRGALDCLARHPSNLEANRIAARQLSQLLYPDEAEPYYEVLRRRGAFGLEDAQERALGLTRSNRREPAAAAYELILKDHPDDRLALQRFAALQWSRGRFAEALALAERLAEVPGGAVAGHTILAEVHHDAGDRERSLPHFRRVVELDPDLRELAQPKLIFWTEFGDSLVRTGRAGEARRVLEKPVAELDDPALMELYGQACQDDGAPDEAARWWLRTIEKDPQRISPWVLLARSELKNRRTEDALAYLGRALDLDPRHYEALALAGAAHRSLGHGDEADAFRARAEQVRRTLPPPRTGMGADVVPVPQPGSTP